MGQWAAWAVLLILQNAAFTAVSRARNSKSILYHGVASVFSNGIWFASQFILINISIGIIEDLDWPKAVLLGVLYTICTMIGSLGSHYVLMRFVKKNAER